MHTEIGGISPAVDKCPIKQVSGDHYNFLVVNAKVGGVTNSKPDTPQLLVHD